MSRPAVAAAALAVVLAASSALGQSNAELIQRGRDLYENLQYEEAIQTFSAAIIRRGNTREQEAAIYEVLGLSYLAVGRTDEAEGAFRLVLARDPERALDQGLAPRILQFFEGVKQRWIAEGRPGAQQPQTPTAPPPREPRPVTIEHRSPPQQERGRAVDLAASVVDPDRRASGLVLAYRHGSRGLFRRNAMRNANGRFGGDIPGAEVRPPYVEYYLEAVDENGIAVAARGDAYAPLRVVVPAEAAPAVWTRWWFWTGAAVLVAGVAVGSYFLFSGAEEPAHLTIDVQAQ